MEVVTICVSFMFQLSYHIVAGNTGDAFSITTETVNENDIGIVKTAGQIDREKVALYTLKVSSHISSFLLQQIHNMKIKSTNRL